MKKTVDRILTVFICAAMLISCFGVLAYADTPLKGSYVEFVKDDSANTIFAKAYVRNPEGNAQTEAWLLLAEYNGDVMEKASTNKLALAAGKENFITTSAIEYNSARKYSAYLWYGDESCRPIVPTATYGYNGQLLIGITVDGVEMEGFSASKTEYTLPPASDGVVPVTKGITADNSVYTTTSYVQSGTDYIAKVSAKSSDGSRTETYTITYTNLIYDTSNGYNAWHAISDYNGKDMTNSENWAQDAETYNGWYTAESNTMSNATIPVLCSNLHGNSDLGNADITGSRWVIDYSPAKGREAAQGQQMLSVPDSIVGLDYFVFSNNQRQNIYKTDDSLVSFKINKPAEVIIYSQADTDKYKDADGEFDGNTRLSESEAPIAAYKQGTFTGNQEITDKSWNNALNTAGAAQKIAYYYKTSKKYILDTESEKTITISMASDLKDRTPIVVIKPISVNPMFEYNMTYGEMNLDAFCTAARRVKNSEYKGKAGKNVKTNDIRPITTDSYYCADKNLTGPTIIDNNYKQRYINSIEKTSGFENAYLTATDRELTQSGGNLGWECDVFYNKQTSDTDGYPLTEKPGGDLVWQTFKVKRDCEVFVFSCASKDNSPQFVKVPENGWTALDFNTAAKDTITPFTAIRGTYYGWSGTPTNTNYQCAYVKEYRAGDTVNLYNSGSPGAAGEELPYMTVVRFK